MKLSVLASYVKPAVSDIVSHIARMHMYVLLLSPAVHGPYC
jgi:hypothetical protein